MKTAAILLSLLFAADVIAAAGHECEQLPAAPDKTIAGAVDRIIEAATEQGFAGGVAIARNGELVYSRVAGTADRAGSVPVGDATLFHVASMTKYFTAILVLKAAEEDVLPLDAPIAPYVKGTQLADRGYTVLDLLAHRSGLGSSYAAERVSDAGEAILAIDAAGISEEDAGSFRYSNDGYDLLGIILEQVYGRPYEELVAEKLFGPACVTAFGFWGTTDVTDPQRVSQPLRDLPDLTGRNYGMLSSAGLLITAADLVRFQLALRAGKVLAQPGLAELYAPRGEISIGSVTLGAFLVERPELGQAISVRGYEDWGDNGFLFDYPQCKLTLAVLTSRGPAEDSGRPAFRVSLSEAIEKDVLAPLCR